MRELVRGATDPRMRKAVEYLPKHLQSFQQAGTRSEPPAPIFAG